MQIFFNDNDDFKTQLSINFAKQIYQILNIKWADKTPVPLQVLLDSIAKANENDNKLLSLLYDSVGVMNRSL